VEILIMLSVKGSPARNPAKNKLMLSAIANAGYKSAAEFSKACDVNYVTLLNYISLRQTM